MVLHDCLHGGIRPCAAGDPRGKLAVPHEVVASKILSIGFGQVCNGITSAEGEDILLWLGGIPLFNDVRALDFVHIFKSCQAKYLHGVSGSKLTEVISVGQLRGVRDVRQLWVVSGTTEVGKASCFGCCIQASCLGPW